MAQSFKKFIVSLLEECNITETFNDLFVFESAFTHSSYKNKEPEAIDYERLEILGDSLITLVITEKLYEQSFSLKKISVSRKEIISGSSLSGISKLLNFQEYIRMDGGCEMSDAVLEDVYEAFIGAIYLTMGYGSAKKAVEHTLYDSYLKGNILINIDYKTQLQEKIQFLFKDNKLTYSLDDRYRDGQGRDVFSVSVKLEDRILGRGVGYRKKLAEQKSAEDALIKLDHTY